VDRAGLVSQAVVSVSSEASQVHTVYTTDQSGVILCKLLPWGPYVIHVTKPGFRPATLNLEMDSALLIERTIQLDLASVAATVQVDSVSTMIDPDLPSSVMQIGVQTIEDRLTSLPGRSVQDLVDTQPGWLYEGDAVLHPRGSEYQTQFVIDGIPLTDNRSPGFGPEIEADDLSSLRIYTAGFPAEYGRKLGGVVELNTRDESGAGAHGQLLLSGGSYATASSSGELQYLRGKNTYGMTGSGSMSSHYLNPVVPENYTNTGTTGDLSGRYERDFSDRNRLTLSVRHELARFLIPNELVQDQAGQRQNGDNFETMGTVRYQHIFSPDALGALYGMVRSNSNDLNSNTNSTPIIALQHNHFKEAYFKATFAWHRGYHELKAGLESDNTFLYEDFSYSITDPTQFDASTPAELGFVAHHSDIEPSAFVEDLAHFGNWSIRAGLRYDHYQLLLNRSALSPRISIGRYFPSADLMLHASYDRIFQTPSFENILISSSAQIEELNDQFLRLPVRLSRGNYEEGGLSKVLFSRGRLDANMYRRDFSNYADDDQLLNTGVSYPIAFKRATIYGAEGKLELLHLGQLSGFVSYSYMVGNVWLPVTGGLFLGAPASDAGTQISGHFPDSQDQRNTVRTRFRYQVTPRVWLASGASFGSGLPFAYSGDASTALAQYGADVVHRLNFARGRTLPLLAVDATAAMALVTKDPWKVTLQVDGENLNNRLNVLDFGGLFSGNAIGPGRSFALRLRTSF
jgi:hypothetical protein